MFLEIRLFFKESFHEKSFLFYKCYFMDMDAIFKYTDYRRFLKDAYEERKRTAVFSWREFAKLSGFASSGYLKLVCDGKTRLTESGTIQVAKALNLNATEERYLIAMVNFCDAASDEAKLQAYGTMHSIGKENRVQIVGSEAFDYYSSWVNSVIREIAPLMEGESISEMGRTCEPAVSAAEVRNALKTMMQAGILVRDEDGGYHQTSKGITSNNVNLAPAIRTMQKQMISLAQLSLENVPASERNISGLTMGINEEAYRQIVKELDRCRKRISEIAAGVTHYDRVYRLNLQLFPLSKKISAKPKRA